MFIIINPLQLKLKKNLQDNRVSEILEIFFIFQLSSFVEQDFKVNISKLFSLKQKVAKAIYINILN